MKAICHLQIAEKAWTLVVVLVLSGCQDGAKSGQKVNQGKELPVKAEKAWTLVVLVLSGCQGGAKDGAFLEPELSPAHSKPPLPLPIHTE